MAIAYDHSALLFSEQFGTQTIAYTCSGTNRILFVEASGIASATVTYGGVSMTALAGDPSNYYTSIFYLINPASGANNVVVSGTFGRGSATAVSYNGANRIDSNSTFTWETTNNVAKSTTVVNSNCWLIAFGYKTASFDATLSTTLTQRLMQHWYSNGPYTAVIISDSNGTVGTGSQGTTFTYSSNDYSGYFGVLSISPPFSYSAPLTTGYFSLTGYNTAVLKAHGYIVALATGYYNLTGNTTSLIKHITTSLTTGYYTLTGYTSTLTRQIRTTLRTGYYNLSGFTTGIVAPLNHTVWTLYTFASTVWNKINKN